MIYALTDIGESLLPIIDAMADWETATRRASDKNMAEESSVYIGFFSGNQLKVIACIAMLIDHIG